MGRRRFQQPSIFKTTGKRPMWYFRARVDMLDAHDGQKQITRTEERYYVGYCDEMTKSDAKKRRDEILSVAINRPQVLIPSQVKFGEVIKIYRRDHLPGLRDTTRAMQESAIRKHIEPTLGGLRMCDLDALAIQRWLAALPLAHRTKRGYLALVRMLWRRAKDWGYTQDSFPSCKFSLGVRRAIKGHEMPSMDQIRRLLAVLDDPFRAMAEIALYSGLRISEIRGLKWEDIGPVLLTIRRRISERGGVDVPKSVRGNRTLDMRPLAATFARLPRTSEWIFNHAGCSYYNCLDKMQAAREAAGITVARFGWHHLRSIFNTLARSSGGDSLDRQALMGHSTEAMNMVYVMQAEGDLKRRGDLMLAVQNVILGSTKGVQ